MHGKFVANGTIDVFNDVYTSTSGMEFSLNTADKLNQIGFTVGRYMQANDADGILEEISASYTLGLTGGFGWFGLNVHSTGSASWVPDCYLYSGLDTLSHGPTVWGHTVPTADLLQMTVPGSLLTVEEYVQIYGTLPPNVQQPQDNTT